jgi:hypothetical protein
MMMNQTMSQNDIAHSSAAGWPSPAAWVLRQAGASPPSDEQWSAPASGASSDPGGGDGCTVRRTVLGLTSIE